MPYIKLEPLDKMPIEWRWMSHHCEETGETYWELCAIVRRLHKDTGEMWSTPIGIPEAEIDLMTREELDKLKGDMINDAIKMLEENDYTLEK